jgi:4-hydroxy-tetrahydrodipicolinate synthase
MTIDFKGAYTAMVTPFNSDGTKIDVEGLKENVDFQIENGISGLVPLGTTGESPTINDDERQLVIETVVGQAAKRVPVIVGTGSNSTEHAIRQSQEAEKLGADAVLIVAPYYNKPTQEGLFQHYKAISGAIKIPVVVYNIQGRTSVNIEPRTFKRLSQLENIVAVKEASGNLAQVMELIQIAQNQNKELQILSGDDNMTLPILALGGNGVISVASNLMPRKVSELCAAGLMGDYGRARALHYELLPLFKALFLETNPAPIKEAMKYCYFPAGPVRLPLTAMQEPNRHTLISVIQEYRPYKEHPRSEITRTKIAVTA